MRLHRGLAHVLVGLVLLQAVVAGQALFGEWEIRVHGWMGNASFALGLLLVWSAWRARSGKIGIASAGALLGLMFAQVGLGYAGRTSASAASWHLPLGVAIFGLAAVHAAVVTIAAGDRS